MFESMLGAVEVAGQVRDAAATLASDARSCSRWTASDRAAALDCVRAAEAALAEARAHLLVATRASGLLQQPGDRSFEGALGRTTRIGAREATRQVRQADTLVSMPSVAAGVRDGLVPLGHLDALARVAATAAPEVAAALRSPESQEWVVQVARSSSASDFATSLAQHVASQDPAALEVAFEAQRRERFLTLSTQPHGVFLKGRLDVTAAESLRIALDLMDQHPDDDRTAGQASADALRLLAERACAGEAGSVLARDESVARTSGTTSRPHLSLLVPAETFVELIRHQEESDRGLTDPGRRVAPVATPPWSTVAPWRAVPPATLEDGTPVPMSELARAMCDADLSRIVMSAEGMPLDVGRAKRLFTPAMRRAAIARDRQCAWNGCTTPVSRCEMHHLRWWDAHHGATSLTNAALVCPHHHRLIHQLDLTVQRLAQPPGWMRRQQRERRPVPPATPGIDGHPMRYVFRDSTGRAVNAPDGSPDDTG